MAEIRRIRVDDAPVVRDLYRAYAAALAERYPEDAIGISEQGLSNLETLFRLGVVRDDEATFVADDGGELTGFVTASVRRGRALPGVAGEIGELWATEPGLERRLAETAVQRLLERGGGAIFHTEDAEHPAREPWESLAADVVRFSRYA
ncbi:MAG: hypothetical protein ICV64_00850 [Thermoleophilia bacterium]|nr:hypothetical protein [Thermoleophilia bacterium]